jgi:protein required for attachment to host cells
MMLEIKRRWVIVADSSHAKIFVSYNKRLSILEELYDSESREHSSQLGSSPPGRSFESVGNMRHSIEPRADIHQKAKHIFAQRLANFINKAVCDKKLDSLTLICPPKMLGDLRHNLSIEVRDLLELEIDKDLVYFPTEQIAEYIKHYTSHKQLLTT